MSCTVAKKIWIGFLIISCVSMVQVSPRSNHKYCRNDCAKLRFEDYKTITIFPFLLPSLTCSLITRHCVRWTASEQAYITNKTFNLFRILSDFSYSSQGKLSGRIISSWKYNTAWFCTTQQQNAALQFVKNFGVAVSGSNISCRKY